MKINHNIFNVLKNRCKTREDYEFICNYIISELGIIDYGTSEHFRDRIKDKVTIFENPKLRLRK